MHERLGAIQRPNPNSIGPTEVQNRAEVLTQDDDSMDEDATEGEFSGQSTRPPPSVLSVEATEQRLDPELLEERAHRAAGFRRQGLEFFQAGNVTQAHANFRFALNCTPDDAELHALIANTSLRLGASHLATHHAEIAVASQPDNPDALIALAGARLRLKSPDTQEAIDALGQFEHLRDFCGLLKIALNAGEGDYEAGLFDLAAYLEIHPRHVMAGELLAATFLSFQASGEAERFNRFIEGVGVLADPEARAALPHKAPVSDACVDIIIPVYNAVEDLAQCLASIRRWPSRAVRRIILVDDYSSQETAKWLKNYSDRHSDVQLVRNSDNLGFTRAVMEGVRKSDAPYMLFLNSDTQVTPHWLDGMLKAMAARPNTALVGPLSNNGYYQTIRPTPPLGAAPTSERAPDDAAALVRCTTQEVFPQVPLLSGFCLLVDRAAFDNVGGLDCEAFPHGYWEVQDLCLKLTDIGYDSVIADNVYVHHEGGGSITESRRQNLINTGLARLYDRYSGLRVLLAEAVCASQPEVARHKKAWSSWIKEKQTGYSRTLAACDARENRYTPARHQWRKWPCVPVADREVCLFVTHSPLGVPSEYSSTYVEELRKNGLVVIACIVADEITIPISEKFVQDVDGLIVRENVGYDFGAWADTLRHLPVLWSAERLYFANDSVLGPFGSLTPTLDSIRTKNAGFFALCECTYMRHHAQSFFFGWNRENLCSEQLKIFWREIENLSDKSDVILRYEMEIINISDELPDETKHIVFGYEKLFGCSKLELSGVSPTHNAWRRLLACGFPFIKTSLLRGGVQNIDTADWAAVCAEHGAVVGAMYRSIETSILSRLAPHRVAVAMPKNDT